MWFLTNLLLGFCCLLQVIWDELTALESQIATDCSRLNCFVLLQLFLWNWFEHSHKSTAAHILSWTHQRNSSDFHFSVEIPIFFENWALSLCCSENSCKITVVLIMSSSHYHFKTFPFKLYTSLQEKMYWSVLHILNNFGCYNFHYSPWQNSELWDVGYLQGFCHFFQHYTLCTERQVSLCFFAPFCFVSFVLLQVWQMCNGCWKIPLRLFIQVW